MHNLHFHNNRRRAEYILKNIHTDFNGSHQTSETHGEKYFLSFIDDYSKLVIKFFVSKKDKGIWILNAAC